MEKISAKKMHHYQLKYIFEDNKLMNSDVFLELNKEEYTEEENKIQPKKIDLRTNYGNIYDQKDLGSCTSNALAAIIRYEVHYDPSRLFIFFNSKLLQNYKTKDSKLDNDEGISINLTLKSIDRYKFCKKDFWPYLEKNYSDMPPQEAYIDAKKSFYKIKYNKINYNKIKDILLKNHLIAFGLKLYSSFEDFRDGFIVPDPTINDKFEGSHCMVIVGYDNDKKLYTVANSWGDDWGDNGFCYISYNYMKTFAADFWYIDSIIVNKPIINDITNK